MSVDTAQKIAGTVNTIGTKDISDIFSISGNNASLRHHTKFLLWEHQQMVAEHRGRESNRLNCCLIVVRKFYLVIYKFICDIYLKLF